MHVGFVPSDQLGFWLVALWGWVIIWTVVGMGLPREEGTSELACPKGWPGRMFLCPSPIRRSSATMS